MKQFDTRIIVNVCGRTVSDYVEVVEKLFDQPVDLLEINVSCPNVKHGGIAFGQHPRSLFDITKEMKAKAKQPIIMKLSPNVTDITEMAKAAEAAGSDAVSLINTITGMKMMSTRGRSRWQIRRAGCPTLRLSRLRCAWYIRWQMPSKYRLLAWAASQMRRTRLNLCWLERQASPSEP